MINSYQRLLNMPYRNYFGFFIVIALIFLLSIYIGSKSLYDRLNLVAVSDGNNLVVAFPTVYSDILNEDTILSINQKNYDYQILQISDLMYDDIRQINYQNYIFQISEKYPLNKIVNVTFYYNKEKIFRKVIKFIKE